MDDRRQTFTHIKHVRRLVNSSILRMPRVMAVATGYKKVQGKRTDLPPVVVPLLEIGCRC